MYIFEHIDIELSALMWIFLMMYITFYFFRGCRRFYGGNRALVNLKSLALVIINLFAIMFVLFLYSLFSVYMVYS
ncbi:hypothetical protein D0T57_02415 [Dysgonomonas sp. 511]|nr:hypothetical protein [Dysgonomonas sp. 511]